MRTTLTFDDDVVAMLKRARAQSPGGFKQLINDLLRAGLQQTLSPKRPVKPYHTPSTDAGRFMLSSAANIEEVLDELEGPMRG